MKMTISGNREKAEGLIKTLGIKQVPIDLNKIAVLLGFNIISYPFPDKRKGMVYVEGKVRVIGINEKHPITLQRYTVAHEFGHFVNGHQHEDNFFIEDETRYYNHHFQQEREADRFAAELLMPVSFLKNDVLIMGLDLNRLKEKYLVSEDAMRIRLETLRFYDKYSKSEKT